jgi:FAD/FMN-containing dehydrogenase/Fe-S oxidoreductase
LRKINLAHPNGATSEHDRRPAGWKLVTADVGVLAAPPRAGDLFGELQTAIAGEVRFDEGSRALYAHDLSVYRQVPIGVVIPRTVDDVIATVAACRRHGVPIFGRGCGTSLSGQCCNAAVVIDFSKYLNRIIELNPDERYAWVEPGVVNDQLRDAAEKHHLTLAPDPATHSYCTLGGMIGNNSCGAHSIMGGKTVDNVEALEILTYTGERLMVGAMSDDQLEQAIREGGFRGEAYRRLKELRDRCADDVRARYPRIPRRVSGYNLDQLLPENGFHVARALVGSESTCVLVLRAKLRLIPSPRCRALLVIGFDDICSSADQVPAVLHNPLLALEAVDQHVVEHMRRKGHELPAARRLPDGSAWLLAEFGGDTQDEADAAAKKAGENIRKLSGVRGLELFSDEAEQEQVWEIREAGVAASRIPHVEDAWPSWEDAAVPPEKLGAYLREFITLLRRYEYQYTLFGHFGQGCVHCRICFELNTEPGVRRFRSFMQEAADLVVRYGGSLSGEHGDGQAKGELLPKMFGERLMMAMREFKTIWDPDWKMNPGKVVDAYPLDTNLRVGPDYHRRPVATHFQFPEDEGSFAAATERCFGIGKCRHLNEGTMCPSFMATREEMHSTRGRAHLLFEMLRGDALHGGWRDPHVHESLNLCLACKGCKGDCPVTTDVATYKAEFLSHYYEGRARPRAHHFLGRVERWARIASIAPRLANAFTQSPRLSRLVKWAAGIENERPLPAFARRTFRHGFESGRGARTEGREILLWTDTFTNFFEPDVAHAAVEVLEAAGCRVRLPRGGLCCGRPLYDYGMLDRAKRQLQAIIAALRDDIRAGTQVIVLEPSCASVFRDEMLNLFPNDADARRLRDQVKTLAEFLRELGWRPPRLQRSAVMHAHCHHKAVLGTAAEETLLRDAGLDLQVLDAGCCGVAGSFGYEHYELSMKIGEQRLLPAVRAAQSGALIVADGFSCRSQIAHGSDRRGIHIAQALQLALHTGEQRAAEANSDQTARRLQPAK